MSYPDRGTCGGNSFDAGVHEHDIQLPGRVNVISIYEPLGDELPFEVNPDDSIYCLQLKTRSTSFMEALLIGRLAVAKFAFPMLINCRRPYRTIAPAHRSGWWANSCQKSTFRT